MGPGYTGTKTLSDKLTKILYTHIKHNLPDIIKEINERIYEVTERLTELGPGIPEDSNEKLQMAWSMVIDFCTKFNNAISGREHMKGIRKNQENKYQGGARIKMMYYNLYKEYSEPDFKITNEYDDEFIQNVILHYEGDSMPGFPSSGVFNSLIQPHIEELKNPALELMQDVYNYIEELATVIQTQTFIRFPNFGEEIMEKIIEIMEEERNKTQNLVESLIDSEIIYMFTNDPEYLNTRTDILPVEFKEDKKEDKKQIITEGSQTASKNTAIVGAPLNKEKSNTNIPNFKKDKKTNKLTGVFINELKARLDCYFRIVIRNIRDSVPKLIGYFLVRGIQNKMQIELFKRLNSMFEAVGRLVGEPQQIIQERKELVAQLETLRKAERVLTRDPEISNMLGSTDDELLIELRQEKAEEAAGKVFDKAKAIEQCLKSVIPEGRLKELSFVPAPAPALAPKPSPPLKKSGQSNLFGPHKHD